MKWLFLMFIFVPKAYSGGAVGNGGGFAKCSDQNLYSYDYLLTLKSHNFGIDKQVSDVWASLEHISLELKRLRDPLSLEFDLYIRSLFQQVRGAKYQWFSQKNLPLMWEPDLDQNLPNGCKKRMQAVYYFAPFSGVTYASYKYDPDLISQVSNQTNGALQVSYLVVHEWLWNFYDRAGFMKLAIFNRLLHSDSLNGMSFQEFSKYKSDVQK